MAAQLFEIDARTAAITTTPEARDLLDRELASTLQLFVSTYFASGQIVCADCDLFGLEVCIFLQPASDKNCIS